MPCGAYKSPSYGGRYNPNYGSGINASNAWKLTTVRGAEWANLKNGETGGVAAAAAGCDAALEAKLKSGVSGGQQVTKSTLEVALAGKDTLSEAERNTLGQFVQSRAGTSAFDTTTTEQLALKLSQGLSLAEAAVQFGFRK